MTSKLTMAMNLYKWSILIHTAGGAGIGVLGTVMEANESMKKELRERTTTIQKVGTVVAHTISYSTIAGYYGILGGSLGFCAGIASPALIIVAPALTVSAIRDRCLNNPRR